MVPIIKNIVVTDDLDRELELTYPRRAKGLVKKGRARWGDDSHTKICLTCPPQYEVEELEMENNIDKSVNSNKAIQLNMEYILNKIDKIISDNEHIHEAFKTLNSMSQTQPGDYAGQAKAEAIGSVVLSRETTNQQLIRLLEKMYNDIKPKESEFDTDF